MNANIAHPSITTTVRLSKVAYCHFTVYTQNQHDSNGKNDEKTHATAPQYEFWHTEFSNRKRNVRQEKNNVKQDYSQTLWLKVTIYDKYIEFFYLSKFIVNSFL